MPKADKITRGFTDYGQVTIVITEENKIYFRAHEIAKLFGFSDTKGCIRKYAEESELVVLPTDGGEQPVKCIPFWDVVEIGFKSRMTGRDSLLYELSTLHKSIENEILAEENARLKKVIAHTMESMEGIVAVLEELKAKMNNQDD